MMANNNLNDPLGSVGFGKVFLAKHLKIKGTMNAVKLFSDYKYNTNIIKCSYFIIYLRKEVKHWFV